MKEFARQIRRHWRDILAYFDHPSHQRCILEGLNSVIQNVKTSSPRIQEWLGYQHHDSPDLRQPDLSTVTT